MVLVDGHVHVHACFDTATVFDAAARSLYTDNPTLPIVLAGVGLVGVIGASRRWAS